jgi:peptidoglycan/LPS O-acetylase OafA/YrhL
MSTEAQIKPARVAHLPHLDGLRGIAILAVLISHLVPVPGRFYLGWMGVQLFFVLSGFLITRILLAERADADRAGTPWSALISFYARRALRIFPIYYLCLLGLCLLRAQHLTDHLPYFLTYTYNIRRMLCPELPCCAEHFWSLSVEEQFYLAWPFLLLFVPRRFLLPTMITVALLAPATRLGLALQRHDRYWLSLLMPCSLDCLALGGMLAWVESRVGTEHLGRSWLARACAWLGCPSLLLFFYLAARVEPLHFRKWFGPGLDVIWVVGNTIQALFFTAAVARACDRRDGDWRRILSLDALRFTGKISYGLYVYHLILLQLAIRPLPVRSHLVVLPGAWLGLPLSFLVAAVSWYALEQPILRLKDRFTQERVRGWFRRAEAEGDGGAAGRRAA